MLLFGVLASLGLAGFAQRDAFFPVIGRSSAVIISPWSRHSGEPLVDSSCGLASLCHLVARKLAPFPYRSLVIRECLATVPVAAMAGVELPPVRLLLF